MGDEVSDGDAERCTGLRATGGGAFLPEELTVDVDNRRSDSAGWLCILGRGLGISSDVEFCARLFVMFDTDDDGLNGGGSFRVPFVLFEFEVRGLGGGAFDEVVCRRPCSIRGTVTQSGSSVGV